MYNRIQNIIKVFDVFFLPDFTKGQGSHLFVSFCMCVTSKLFTGGTDFDVSFFYSKSGACPFKL